MLDSERFIDQPPREVYASLLSEEKYLCSVSTMYRLLRERGATKERRNKREARPHAIPRLVAAAPNRGVDVGHLETRDASARHVSKSLRRARFVQSLRRRVWMVAAHENSALAKQLFAEAVSRYGIDAGSLIVHQDRGAPMTSHGFAELLGELGVERSYSRPRVSNDNPFSESHFRTAKYQPDYPGCFRDLAHARVWCNDFFRWYNDQHHHTGLELFTPRDVFFGNIEKIAARREKALHDAYEPTRSASLKGRLAFADQQRESSSTRSMPSHQPLRPFSRPTTTRSRRSGQRQPSR